LSTIGLTGITGITLLGDTDAAGVGATGVTGIAAGTVLNVNAAQTGSFTYQLSGTSGPSSSVTTNLNITGGDSAFGTLVFQDSLANGVGTLNIVANNSIGNSIDTITTLTDSQLNTLNLSGNASVAVTNAITTGSTAFTLSNNSTATVATILGGITGATMGSLSHSGTHDTTITTLNTGTVAIVTINNANTGTTAGTGVLTIGGHTDTSLNSLSLNGAVALTGTYALNGAAAVSGATDNASVSLTMSGGGNKTIVLGNGNNTIVTGAGVDTITLGTGTNSVNSGAGADAITFGAHTTGADTYNIGAGAGAGGGDSGTFAVPGTNTISTTTFDVVNGLRLGDKVQLAAAVYTGAAGNPLGLVANGVTANTLVGLAVASNTIELVRGTYDSVGKTFVGSATGADSLMVYDSDAVVATTAYEAVVLVGYVATSVTGIGGTTGLVTLA
jgi:hypothetical protein